MNRFVVGFATAWLLDKLAWRFAVSDTREGREVLAKLVARLDHDRLLRVQEAVGKEIIRRRTPGIS
jgi:hypothetical protein